MITRLTETAISAAVRKSADEGKRIELTDATLRGLRLRLTPTGRRTWVLGMRDTAGASKRFTLGEHPTMGISEARDAARLMRAKVKGGGDPIQDSQQRRSEARDARQGVGTLSALLDLYERQRGGVMKSWPEYRRVVSTVFAPLLPRPLPRITVGDIQMLADAYRAPQSASSAVRCLRPILKWAAAPGRAYVPIPLAAITPPAPVKRRERTLSRDELAKVLPVLRSGRTPYHSAALFMLLTLCRREEAGRATWADVDVGAGTWRIPITKNKQPHIVPLPRQALDLLRAIRPLDTAPDALIFATSRGTRLENWHKAQKDIDAETGTTGWTRHDLRRTAATMLGDLGETPDTIEAALNHASIRSPLAATYNRSRYRPQVAAALQRLADALDGIEAGAGEIVAIGGRA
jgi:integrase